MAQFTHSPIILDAVGPVLEPVAEFHYAEDTEVRNGEGFGAGLDVWRWSTE
jgi:hypothetical protein